MDRWTDGWTDRQTDRQTDATKRIISLLHLAMLSIKVVNQLPVMILTDQFIPCFQRTEQKSGLKHGTKA